MIQTITLRDISGLRKAIFYYPEGRTGRLPLVLMLHGIGGTAEWTLDETLWTAHAEREGFCVLVPEGTRADPEAPPGFLKNPMVWNDGASRPGMGFSESDDVAYLESLIHHVVREYAVDEKRIYCTGFSNGAGMTFRLIAEKASLFAGMAAVAGLCAIHDPKPSQPVPCIYIAGTSDPLLPVEGGKVQLPWGMWIQRSPIRTNLQVWANALGCSTATDVVYNSREVTVEKYPAPEGSTAFQVWWIKGHGHHWPGGKGGVSERLCGPIISGVSANQLIWDFFQSLNSPDKRQKT